MRAEEARQKANAVNTDQDNSQYAEIKKKISIEAAKGKYDTYVFDFILPAVKDKLELEGYCIGNDLGRQGDITIAISW